MTQKAHRDAQAGLTLVEVLVALALFSLIGLAGFTMLDNILRAQSGTQGRLERLGQIDRALVVFSRDLQESDSGSVRHDETGITMNRTGTGLLSYQVPLGVLLRSLSRRDFDQQMIDGVNSIRLRSLDSAGMWHDSWPVEQTQSLGLPPTLKAVELQLGLREGTVRRLVDVPAGAEE
ncbi:prepilin-type N-terminal cleavage/methylation domain-containing protein [Sulfitobacter sp.]|uniref:prepilin-type N-terminal cleavage/methylation domain-containing protein n=1 Tax=Sulfitobacter sp. TaxID=1903071 RepID=UPI003F6D6AA2